MWSVVTEESAFIPVECVNKTVTTTYAATIGRVFDVKTMNTREKRLSRDVKIFSAHA